MKLVSENLYNPTIEYFTVFQIKKNWHGLQHDLKLKTNLNLSDNKENIFLF